MGLGIPSRPAPLRPAGRPEGPRFTALKLGAKVLQSSPPLRGFDAYLVGFHPAKDEPDMQMEAHHYCKVVNDDLIQCVLFDGNTAEANLIGIEYIVSGNLFATLPEEEKDLWHPHNYEVFSGQLIAPGLPAVAEQQLMTELVNSYGKTWHTWHTGRHDTGGGDELPLGAPMLMWSFNRDGEGDPALEAHRAAAFGIDPAEVRLRRQELLDRAAPQRGVDALKHHFTGTTPIPGVQDLGPPTSSADGPDGPDGSVPGETEREGQS